MGSQVIFVEQVHKQNRQMLTCFWKSLIPVVSWGLSTILGHMKKSQTAVPLLLPSPHCRIGVYRASQIFAAFTRSDISAMIRREYGVVKWRMEATRSAVPLPIPFIAVGMAQLLSIFRTLRTLRSLLHGSVPSCGLAPQLLLPIASRRYFLFLSPHCPLLQRLRALR